MTYEAGMASPVTHPSDTELADVVNSIWTWMYADSPTKCVLESTMECQVA